MRWDERVPTRSVAAHARNRRTVLVYATVGALFGAFVLHPMTVVIYWFEFNLSGESERVEFKSSARWDYVNNRPNRAIEEAVVRTIAGFLNHRGGSLLIGIDDGGEVVGLKADYHTLRDKNRDGFERFLMGLVRNGLADLCTLPGYISSSAKRTAQPSNPPENGALRPHAAVRRFVRSSGAMPSRPPITAIALRGEPVQTAGLAYEFRVDTEMLTDLREPGAFEELRRGILLDPPDLLGEVLCRVMLALRAPQEGEIVERLANDSGPKAGAPLTAGEHLFNSATLFVEECRDLVCRTTKARVWRFPAVTLIDRHGPSPPGLWSGPRACCRRSWGTDHRTTSVPSRVRDSIMDRIPYYGMVSTVSNICEGRHEINRATR